MKFVDEAIISISSGHGGKGCVGFRREKFIPKGGPDGGDGGKGGDVILKAASRKRTLYDFRYRKQYRAQNGGGGGGSNRTGRDGKDLVVEIPPGTIVIDADTGETIKDFTKEDETFIVAKGGRGGQGNARFKTSTHRTPRFAQPGEPGEEFNLRLELKLLADVGIIGLPNAGKSTLIQAISSATPKIGAYPFTTLIPNLGVVKTEWAEPFVVADIPGLIEGAHEGAGLGIRFLKHIERTRILVHLIDAAEIDMEAPLAGYETINRELSLYSENLAQKPQLVVLNKTDIPDAAEKAAKFADILPEMEIFAVSAAEKSGLSPVLSRIIQLLDQGK